MIAFRCSHSGLYFPADYVKEWGRKYGHGLGPEPVSETLDTYYDQPVCIPSGDGSAAMHPFCVTRAQVDCMDVSEEEYEGKKAVLHIDDVRYTVRAKILQEKQLLKSVHLQKALNK